VVAKELRTLEPAMSQAISNARRIVAGVGRPARGALPTAAQTTAREVEQLLNRAATTIKPGDQAIYVNRAVAIARNYLGNRTSAAIEALGDVGAAQRRLATSFGRRSALYRGAGKVAKYAIPSTLLYQFRDVIRDALR
jgi:hypothetical protein